MSLGCMAPDKTGWSSDRYQLFRRLEFSNVDYPKFPIAVRGWVTSVGPKISDSIKPYTSPLSLAFKNSMPAFERAFCIAFTVLTLESYQRVDSLVGQPSL